MSTHDPTPPPLDSPEEIRALERYYVVGLACMLFLILAFPLYRMGEPERRARAMAALHRENVSLGASLFSQHCAMCHGDRGMATATGEAVGSAEYLAVVTDPQLTWLISGGVPGTAMAAYHVDLGGPFADHEVGWIVTYLRSLPGIAEAEVREVVAEAPEVPEESPGADPDPERVVAPPADLPPRTAVEDAYARYCALCHGSAGEGGPLGSPLRPLPPHLQADPDSAVTLIARGIPGTSMMGYLRELGGPLEADLIWGMVEWFREPPER